MYPFVHQPSPPPTLAVWTCRVYPFPQPAVWMCRVYPFPPLAVWTWVGNFRQKIIPGKTEETEQLVCSGRILAVLRNRNSRNSVPNCSAEEKIAQNSVPWNKIRSKCSEFRSETFRRRENNSEFRSVEQKYKQTPGILFRTIPQKRQQIGIPFQSMSRRKTCCQFSILFAEQDFL